MSLSDSGSTSRPDSQHGIFAPVLASINLDSLPGYASRVRRRYQYRNRQECSAATIVCEVLSPPLCGSFNILFPLEFTDGVRWIVKIPATGYRERYDEISARALKSEALTMRYLKRETTIPIPEVYSFDASIDNEINCPYILMEFIHGSPLCDTWFKPNSSMVSTEQFRANVLKDVAAAMVQLNKFTYNKSGSLVFDDDGNVTGLGPAKVFDGPAYVESFNGDCDPAFFYESGPFDDPRMCFFSAMERHAEPGISQPNPKLSYGTLALLRLFISWVPFEQSAKDSGFVLKHPDLNSQNIFVSEEGHLRGIIDWDGVAAMPHYIGCEEYPLWLTCDWDPWQYVYPDLDPDPDHPQHSPEEFAHYRSMYAEFMDLYLAEEESKSRSQGQQGTTSANACIKTPYRFTRRSLLVQSLALASIEPHKTLEIVGKVFEIIEKTTTSESGSSDLRNGKSAGIDETKPTTVGSCGSDEEESPGMAHQQDGEGDILAHASFNEDEEWKYSSSSILIKIPSITPEMGHRDESNDKSSGAGTESTPVGSSDSDKEQTSGCVHYDEDASMAYGYSAVDYDMQDESSNGSSAETKSTSVKPSDSDKEETSERVNHNEEDDTVTHPSLIDVEEDDYSRFSSLLRKFKQLTGGPHDLSFFLFLVHWLPSMLRSLRGIFVAKFRRQKTKIPKDLVQNTSRPGVSKATEAKSEIVDKLRSCEIGRETGGITDLFHSHRDLITGCIEQDLDVSKANVIASRSAEYCVKRTNINREEMGEADDDTDTITGSNTDTITDMDQGGESALGDDAKTSLLPAQEENRAAQENVNISADPVQEDAAAFDHTAYISKNSNQEKMMELCENTDISANDSQQNTEKVADIADIPRGASWGYKGYGFSLWEVTHALADGVLDETRMQRLKDGFLTLLVSLDVDETVALACSGTENGFD